MLALISGGGGVALQCTATTNHGAPAATELAQLDTESG